MTKRALKSAQRRSRIIDAARLSFWERGYGRTTMSGIAAALGGSKGTLWSYFGSKEELFGAVIEQAVTALRADMIASLESHGPLDVALLHFAEAFIRAITSPDAIALQRMIIGEGSHFPELGRIFYAKAPGATRELLAAFLGGRTSNGATSEDESRRAAAMFLSLCSGGLGQRALFDVEKATEQAVRAEATTAVALFLRIYRSGANNSS